VFWAAAIPGLLSIAVVILGARETGAGARGDRIAHTQSAALPLGRPFFLMLAAVTVFSIGNSSDMFLVLRAQNVGIPVRQAPLLGLVFNLTYTAFSWPAGKLSDRLLRGGPDGAGSRHSIVVAGYLVFAVVYATFAAAPSRLALWLMMALYGVYYALSAPVLRAMVVDTAPREARGRAFGVFFFVTSVATLAASILTGELWKHFGPQVPFYFSAGMAVVAAAMLVFTGKRRVAR
jgi:MFS family permease